MGKISRVFVSAGIIVLISVFFFDYLDLSSPSDMNAETNRKTHRETADNAFHMSKYSLRTLVGKSGNQVKKDFGRPSRIDPSAYGYDWWIYNKSHGNYMQVGVEDGKVVTVFALGKDLNTGALKIGKPAKDVLSGISLDSTVSLQLNGGSYQFELREDEVNARPLVKLGKVWAILYFDKFTHKLEGIRYLKGTTLIKLRPYSLSYRGELPEPERLPRKKWEAVEQAEEREIFEITNLLRRRYGYSELKWNETAAAAAFGHSKDMAVHHYFAHTSPTAGDLGTRLHEANVSYLQAGENIAAHYVDGISATFGWLNSKGHRENLFRDSFTEIGVGVYEKYYTQDFIRPL
ncbi:MAG TPA: CAP domain-containing protein [Bacillales bacterium]|nr:CAP domain-containing protein [Bacillales bacterium]